jgi:hypothetical protein
MTVQLRAATPDDAGPIVQFRFLVKRVEEFFAGRGARRITVLIEVDRPWAVDFWTAVGYPRDEHIVRHVGMLDV